jgi:hypothetical protein
VCIEGESANLEEVDSKFLQRQMQKHDHLIRFLLAAKRYNFGLQIISFRLISWWLSKL